MKSGHLQPGGGFSPPFPDEEAPAMRETLESVLDEHVRPLLRSHGGVWRCLTRQMVCSASASGGSAPDAQPPT